MKHQQFHQRLFVQSALLLFCISVFCGCSICGFLVGKEIDDAVPDKDTLQVEAAINLRPGDEVRISLVDSTVVEGIYKEVAALDSSVYALRYGRFLQSVSPYVTFPRLGDTLLLTTKGDKSQWVYLFRGYGIGTLNIRGLGQSRITSIAFKHLTALENRAGVKLDLGMLETMSNARQLPRDVSLVVKTKLETSRVPLDDIYLLERTNAKNVKIVGLAIGLVVDIIVLTSVNLNLFGGSGGSIFGSKTGKL